MIFSKLTFYIQTPRPLKFSILLLTGAHRIFFKSTLYSSKYFCAKNWSKLSEKIKMAIYYWTYLFVVDGFWRRHRMYQPLPLQQIATHSVVPHQVAQRIELPAPNVEVPANCGYSKMVDPRSAQIWQHVRAGLSVALPHQITAKLRGLPQPLFRLIPAYINKENRKTKFRSDIRFRIFEKQHKYEQ